MGSFSPTIANNPTTQNMTSPMGGPNGQPEQQFAGKGFAPQQGQQPQTFGKGTTNSATSGQPTMGQPNPYPNTTGSWDNSSIQQPPTMPQMAGGKGKGA